MLSGITSYLFGGADAAAHTDAAEPQPDVTTAVVGDNVSSPPGPSGSQCDAGLKTANADEEWVLVDRISQGVLAANDDDATQNFTSELQEDLELNLNCRSSRFTRSNHDVNSTPSSGMSSPMIMLHPSMEESWLVTPPPCFTAGSHVIHDMTTHPLENLLIEHPSMSVYAMRGRHHSTGTDSNQSLSSTHSSPHQQRQVTLRTGLRQARPRVAFAAQQGSLQVENQERALRSVQRATKRQQRLHLSKHNMERSNRARRIQSKGSHPQHRKDKMYAPSGANNNRKLH